MSRDYNNTLNLPKTSFSMRAGLSRKEPETLNSWKEKDIYNKLMEKNEGKPLYILHDGPPYANGDIHLGHALNKILKDFVVRYKNMSGFKSPFVPGWDTHGLPTELKARAKVGTEKASSMSDIELREICHDFAQGYVNDQREQFKRLGIIAEWDNPYITFLKEFEAKQIEVFSDMACKGHIYKGLKPVYWCPECNTALAEAEIEYSEDKCHSIYVKFPVVADGAKLRRKGAVLGNTYFVIWTTTTWTLPGNVAICLGKDFNYSLIKCENEYYIMAEELYKNCMKIAGKEDYSVIATFKGSELENMKVRHPFLKRDSLVIVGDHVTLESGTGCVHTAPGHGVEDFEVCKNYPELPIVVPVDSNGKLTEEAGKMFAGLTTKEANKEIAKYLDENGYLFAIEKIVHQYPHCWRCKEPVLFRATEQWFCSIDDFKDEAVEAIKGVEWIPGWGEDRITSMVRERKDWCISRQRKWGVPIPIFFCKNCGEPLIDKNVMMAVSDLFREEGSNSWFIRTAEEILPSGTKCKKCGSTSFEKEKDIMDVWFDSGTSHAAVCGERPYLSWPADLYLEGADQYRGWFQSSLLTAIATKGHAPYKTVVTHGWVVDGDGHKQSKSLGNGISPDKIINQYGADILRLWVASADYHSDVRISDSILKQLSESYRKIRNTARYILGNLYDFDPNKDMVPVNELLPIDKWALSKLDELNQKVRNAYDKFEFHHVYHDIYNFCVVDMSNFYLDVLKDRLYVEDSENKLRRSAQTTIYMILDAMSRFISPILAFTSEEIWKYMPHSKNDDEEFVLFNNMPELSGVYVDDSFKEYWDKIHLIRDEIQKALEIARKNKIIGAPLDAKVMIYGNEDNIKFIKSCESDLKSALIVSDIEILSDGQGEYSSDQLEGISVTILHADGNKCELCWEYSNSVGTNDKYSTLCSRCASIIEKQDKDQESTITEEVVEEKEEK